MKENIRYGSLISSKKKADRLHVDSGKWNKVSSPAVSGVIGAGFFDLRSFSYLVRTFRFLRGGKFPS